MEFQVKILNPNKTEYTYNDGGYNPSHITCTVYLSGVAHLEYMEANPPKSGKGTKLLNGLISTLNATPATKLFIQPDYGSRGFYEKYIQSKALDYEYGESPFNDGNPGIYILLKES